MLLKYYILMLALVGCATAPPIAGFRYAGYVNCSAMVVVCFGAAGFTFGTVPGAQIAAVPALVACTTAYDVCMEAYRAALAA